MTQLNDIDALRYLADFVRERVLPEDQGSWDLFGPANSDRTINQILDHCGGNCDPMPADIADALGLPEGSAFTVGVKEIWKFHDQ